MSFLSRRRLSVLATVAVMSASGGLELLAASPAQAAGTTFNVTTTADIAANAGACGNTGITTPPSPSSLSLREATCLANNVHGTVTINIPAGHYTLTSGELQLSKVAGDNASLVGAGAGTTIVDGANSSRVLELDPGIVGGVTNSISGLTITGGADSGFGGAGIIAGSGTALAADVLDLANVVITGNHANGTTPTATNNPGGGVQFIGGKLTITNSTISGNTAGSSAGSGVYYDARGTASPESLTITGSTFSGNSDANAAATLPEGGALALRGQTTTPFTVTNTRFVNNTVTSTSGSGPAVGGAIWQQSGLLTVTGSTFTGNSVSGAGGATGGAIEVSGGSATLHYNRLTGNTASTGSALHNTSGTVDAAENWWGCNTGPGGAGCDTTAGTVTTAPRLVLTATASP